MKELDTGNGNSDSYSNFLAAIYLDKYRNYALMKNWEQAHAALTSAHEILLNNKLLSLEQAELLAAVYAYQGVTDYYTNSKSNQVALDSIPKLKELANKFSKSWRITYYNLRNRNNLAVIANNEEEFHDISKEIHDLWSSSNENFDLALWAYVIQQNAYYSETSWKNMSLKELSELIEIVPSLNKFSPGQTVEIVKYLHNMLTRTAKRLAHEVIDRDKEERNRILKKLNEITLELELLLPSSNLAYERRSQYFTLEKLCRETGVEWRDRDSFLIAEASFISRTKHKFSKATRANMANLSGVSNNTSIAGSLDKLIKKPSFVYELQFIARRAQSYTLKELDDLVSNGPIRTIVSNIDKLEDGSEIKIAATRLRDAYITSFQKAPSSLKNDYISNFCNVNDNLISNLLSDRKSDDIITFWEKSFKNVDFQKPTTEDREAIVKHAKYASQAYLDLGDLTSAMKINDEIHITRQKISYRFSVPPIRSN